ERKIRIQAFEAHLFLAGLADLQPVEGEFEAERVELDALQVRRHRGVLGQLLVGDTQADAGKDEKAEQAEQGYDGQQGAEGACQSFGHVWRHLSGAGVPWSMAR